MGFDIPPEIVAFSMSPGVPAGFIGAVIIVAASVYRNVGVNLLGVKRKTLFLAMGTLVGATIWHIEVTPDFLRCMAGGAGWLHLPVVMKIVLDLYIQSKINQNSGNNN